MIKESDIYHDLWCDLGRVGDVVRVHHHKVMRGGARIEEMVNYLPKKGRIVYISPRGWAVLEMLNSADRFLYRETCWLTKKGGEA